MVFSEKRIRLRNRLQYVSNENINNMECSPHLLVGMDELTAFF